MSEVSIIEWLKVATAVVQIVQNAKKLTAVAVKIVQGVKNWFKGKGKEKPRKRTKKRSRR